MTSHGFSLKRCILDAIFSGLIALIIFGPIAGVVLDGYSFNFAGQVHVFRHVLKPTAQVFMSGHRNTKAACAGLFPW